MHRILLSILLTTSLFAKEIIAVLDLEQIGLTPQEAQILTQRLTTKLISLNKYQVVERTNMDKILKEQKFQSSTPKFFQAARGNFLLRITISEMRGSL